MSDRHASRRRTHRARRPAGLAAAVVLTAALAACGGDGSFEDRDRAELRADPGFAAALDAGGEQAADAATAYVGDLCDFLASGSFGSEIEGSIAGSLEFPTVLAQARAGDTTSFTELRNRTAALRTALVEAAPGPAIAGYLELARTQSLALLDAAEDAGYELGPTVAEAVQQAGRAELGVAPDADAAVYLSTYRELVERATADLRTACGEELVPELPAGTPPPD